MRKTITPLLVLLLLAAAVSVAARQLTADERDALRARLEQRFDIVPLSDAVGLRPKAPMGDVRLIEVAETISINGVTVTGRELREKVGDDADAILRLNYLDADARQALVAPPTTAPAAPPAPGQPALEPSEPLPPAMPEAPRRRRSGDRVRIFGDVHVLGDEVISGQVVAVMGSVRVDGEVGDQVVAVMGSVHLGPNAVVRGDIVSVGGRVHRAAGAQVRGDVTEVALGGGVFTGPRGDRWPVVVGPRFGFWDGFGALPRLIGSTFRLLLLALLASIAFLVARPVVEGAAERIRDQPVHTTLIGVLAVLLLGPVLFLLSITLVISLIGIPLLITIPFLVFALMLMALAGFSGTAYAIGQWARRRLNMAATASPFLDVSLGVLIILLPLLLGRIVALGGWWSNPFALLLVVVGFGLEFLAWSAGFGAVLTNGFGRWQARRAAAAGPPAPPAAVPPNVGP